METFEKEEAIINEAMKNQQEKICLGNKYNSGELNVGQVFKDRNEKFTYVKIKNQKAIALRQSDNREVLFNIWAEIEFVDEIDPRAKEKLNKMADKENQVRDMARGQHFIGNDDKEYIFVEVKKTRFEMADISNIDIRYNAPFGFMKEELDKRTSMYKNSNENDLGR